MPSETSLAPLIVSRMLIKDKTRFFAGKFKTKLIPFTLSLSVLLKQKLTIIVFDYFRLFIYLYLLINPAPTTLLNTCLRSIPPQHSLTLLIHSINCTHHGESAWLPVYTFTYLHSSLRQQTLPALFINHSNKINSHFCAPPPPGPHRTFAADTNSQ